jgi:glycosyltransferase involved in cell wall biosynthesis
MKKGMVGGISAGNRDNEDESGDGVSGDCVVQITFLLTQSLESPGGGGRYFPLAKALVALGHQVTILALHHNYRQLRRRRFVRDGVTIAYVGQMHVRKEGNLKQYFSPLALLWITAVATLRLTYAALRHPGDIIHVGKTQPMNGVAAWIVHRLRGVPVYVDSDDYEAVNNRFSGRWQQRVVAWFEDWLPSFAQGLTVGNSFIGERFASLGYPTEKIVLVPNGADRATFAVLDRPESARRLDLLRDELGLVKGQPVVVYVGSMSLVSHAIDLLLEAFVHVTAQLPETRLLLVGGGEDLKRLHQMAAKLGIAGHVNFVGRVPTAEVPFYYRLGMVSVDPMRDSLPARSSLSLKLIESIAAGVPCVTSDIGDRRRMVGEAGMAVPPDDAVALANGLLSVLENAEVAAQMRRAACSLRAENWWDVRVRDFSSLYPYVG